MKLKKILLLAASSILLTACSLPSNIYFASIVSLSGDYHLSGMGVKNGINLALAKRPEVIGKKVKFVIKDNRSEHINNLDLYNKLSASKKFSAFLDGCNSVLSEDIAAVSQKKPLPIVVATASLSSITGYGENIYRVGITDEAQGVCMADLAIKDLNLDTAAVFYDTDKNYSVTIAKQFVEEFEKNGGKILTQQKHISDDNDFRIQLSKIKLLKPKVLFIPDYAYDSVLVIKQIRDLGMDCVILGPDTWEELLDQSSDKSILNGVYYCCNFTADNPNGKVQDFVREYKEKYGSEPSSTAALAYDSVNVLLDAVQGANSTDKDEILKALPNVKFDGVTGNISFDDSKNNRKSFDIVRIIDGHNKFYKTIYAK